MLQRENDLRLSSKTQHAFKSAAAAARRNQNSEYTGGSAWLEVVEDLQRQVATEFGLSEKVGLDALRNAESILRNNPQDLIDVKKISLYRKYNRCRDGNLSVGDFSPNAPLVRVCVDDDRQDYTNASVHGLLSLSPKMPLVLLVGSYT